MKIKVLLAMLMLSLSLTACSSQEARDLVEEGKMALEKHEYTQAQQLLSEALQADSANNHARAMYIQATRMKNALEYEKQENYKKAISEIEVIEKIKDGSSAIKSEASKKKIELEKLQKEYEIAQEERKENAKVTSGNDVYKIEQEAIKEQQLLEEEQKKEEEEKLKQEQEQNNQNSGDEQLEGGIIQTPEQTQITTPQIVQ